MKYLLILLHILCTTGFCQDSSYSVKKAMPVKLITNNKDTLSTKGQLTIHHESKTDMLAILADTTYLNKIVGIYLVGNSGPEIRIERRDKVLSITLPGYLASDLIPITSSLFKLKDQSDTKMFLYFDQKNNIPAINIQNLKENYGANRKGYRFD